MFPKLHQVAQQVNQIIIGKPQQIRLALTCILAGGHLLIEDLPGVGKTTLAHALSKSLGLQFNRLQFTSDLLPADVAGISIFDREKSRFIFHPGPIFAQVLLADEINRATPKTQSALLEAMEERQVSVEGQTRPLPTPFFVIATQNPAHQLGTFPLPESQLDRFLMCLSLGYPDADAERALLAGDDRRHLLQTLSAVMRAEDLLAAQQALKSLHVSAALISYVQRLAQATRHGDNFVEGLSPRGALALLQAARAWAALEGRNHVLPEDVQAVFIAVVAHRLRPLKSVLGKSGSSADLLRQLLSNIAV